MNDETPIDERPMCRCRGARALYMPDGRTLFPCPDCVPDIDRWRAARIPERYLDAPLSTLPGPEIAVSRYLFGEPGRGKTRKAIGILKRQARARFGGLFAEMVALEGQRRNAITNDEPLPGPDLFTAPFLVADDIGRNVRATDFWAEFVVDLVRARYIAELPTVWTSNFTIEQLAKPFGEWAASRIGEMCGERVHEVKGRDWRVPSTPPSPSSPEATR